MGDVLFPDRAKTSAVAEVEISHHSVLAETAPARNRNTTKNNNLFQVCIYIYMDPTTKQVYIIIKYPGTFFF